MKKIISLIIILITLAACSGKEGVKPQLCGISFTADITYYNENYKGDFTVLDNGDMTVIIREPEILEGYTVTVANGKMTAEYLGLTFVPGTGNMPFSGVLDEVYSKLTEIRGSSLLANLKNGEYILKDGKDLSEYTLYVSPTGLPQRLLIPDEAFSVYFYNVSIINKG